MSLSEPQLANCIPTGRQRHGMRLGRQLALKELQHAGRTCCYLCVRGAMTEAQFTETFYPQNMKMRS